RTGDDWMFSDRVSAQSGSVAPVEGSPEATALENKAAGGGMANYPAHDGLAGPSDTSSVRAGDDWARSSVDIADAGRIGTARLDDATGGASGGANVIHDDPNGFLAANADATGGSAATPDAFIDQSETYLTRGFDTSQAATPDADTTWSGDDIAGPASVADAGGAENPHVSTDDGQLTPYANTRPTAKTDRPERAARDVNSGLPSSTAPDPRDRPDPGQASPRPGARNRRAHG